MPPPAENPTTKMRRRSDPKRAIAARTIRRIDIASPPPRRTSSGRNQLKQRPELFS